MLLHNAVRENTPNYVKTPPETSLGDRNTLCSLFPTDPEVYFFQIGSASYIPIIIRPMILFIHVYSVQAVGRIRLGARKLPLPPDF